MATAERWLIRHIPRRSVKHLAGMACRGEASLGVLRYGSVRHGTVWQARQGRSWYGAAGRGMAGLARRVGFRRGTERQVLAWYGRLGSQKY